MVWPERRLKLLAPPGAAGLEGFQALLDVLGMAYVAEAKSENEEQAVHMQDGWIEDEEEIILTDLIYWPGISQIEHKLSEARGRGMAVASPAEFLAKTWQVEHILPVPSSWAVNGEKPMLWVILQEAGFFPSLLWYEENGWKGIRGEGTAWIVPAEWLSQISEDKPLGRPLNKQEVTWVIRVEGIDFYEAKERLTFRGTMPRWQEPLSEQGACTAVAQALGMGISWADIRRALSQETSKQGWQTHDFGRTQGPDREELPVAETHDVEDRRAG